MVQVSTDPGPIGWGTHYNSLTIHGLWSPEELELHFNHLELWDIIKAFCAFDKILGGHAVQVATNDTTALFYISKQGGTHSLFLLYLAGQL